jgi:hypothetical protein
LAEAVDRRRLQKIHSSRFASDSRASATDREAPILLLANPYTAFL